MHDLGRYYAITDVMHKRYSAGTPNQTYLQALFRLLQANRIVPDQIQQIEVHLPMRGVTRIANALRQGAQLPWFVRNVVVKAALLARLRPLARLLGHRGSDWPY